MSDHDTPAQFVDVTWLKDHLHAPDVHIIDATWHLPTAGRNAHDEYLAEHIPGATFFDLDAVTDKSSNLPHMLPDPIAFSSAMRKMGVGDGCRVVVYDSYGLFSAARVWWTLRAFGVSDVFVLEGGLPAWKEAGLALAQGEELTRPRHFTARLDHGALASVEDVKKALSGSAQVVDARSAERFSGDAPEPRPGLKSGHMPGAKNLPFDRLVENGRLKNPAAIRAEFEKAGVDLSKPIVTTCGSGVTAAVLTLALESAAHKNSALYDGSWAEWGARPDCPVTKGAKGG